MTAAEAGPPEAGQPAPEPPPAADGAGIWVGLGLGLLMLASFGSFGLLVVGVVGWSIWRELPEVPALLLAVALFLSSGGGVAARLKPALHWGALAILAGSVLLLPFLANDQPPARSMEVLEFPARIAGLVWLVGIALIGWRFPLPTRLQGPSLLLVVATSRLVVYPAMALLAAGYALIAGELGGLILLPVALGGIAIGMAVVLLLGAAIAWGAQGLRRWIAPTRVIAVLAVLLLLLRLGAMFAA